MEKKAGGKILQWKSGRVMKFPSISTITDSYDTSSAT